MPREEPLQFPVIALGAEHLAMAMLMRRNLLAYKAPPNHAGYDLICIHPDPRHSSVAARVQVKCRYATDSNRSLPASVQSSDSYDFLIFVLMNIGRFYTKKPKGSDATVPVLYTIPREVAKTFYKGAKIVLPKSNLESYKDEAGFELIASFLQVPRPERRALKRRGT